MAVMIDEILRKWQAGQQPIITAVTARSPSPRILVECVISLRELERFCARAPFSEIVELSNRSAIRHSRVACCTQAMAGC